MTMTVDPACAGERQPTSRAPRRRVLKGGVVAFNQRHSAFACTVRNLSETGCLLTSDSAMSIPDTFELIIDLDGFEVECAVVRRNGPSVGARFISPIRQMPPRRVQIINALTPAGKPSLRRAPR